MYIIKISNLGWVRMIDDSGLAELTIKKEYALVFSNQATAEKTAKEIIENSRDYYTIERI